MKSNKIITGLLCLAVSVTVFTSCQNDERRQAAYTISQISNPTDADSLMFYFGQLRAIKFWRDADTDTLLRTQTAQKEYLAGVEAGLKALDKSEAYLKGLLVGADLAESIREYSRNYGRTFNSDIMMKSMRSTLNQDSAPDLMKVRHEFYSIRNNMEMMRDARESEKADIALQAAGEKMEMTKITNDLWKKVMVEGAGPEIVRGSRAEVAMQLTTLAGHKIPLVLPNEIVVGARLISTVFSDALLTMRYGERCEFLTTALALFGSHARQMDLSPDDVLVLTISIIGEVAGNGAPGEDIPDV